MKTPKTNSSSGSKAPTHGATTIANAPDALHSEQTAVTVANDAAATPPGVSVPGGTNTGPADGDGPQMGATEGHDPAGAVAATAPAIPSITPADGNATVEDGAGNQASPAEAPAWTMMNREEFEVAYPLTFALFSVPLPEPRSIDNPPLVRVKSKTPGFRRGGIAHSKDGQDFVPGELTPDQIEAFLADPELTVEIV